jgi:hypothetical protein
MYVIPLNFSVTMRRRIVKCHMQRRCYNFGLSQVTKCMLESYSIHEFIKPVQLYQYLCVFYIVRNSFGTST